VVPHMTLGTNPPWNDIGRAGRTPLNRGEGSRALSLRGVREGKDVPLERNDHSDTKLRTHHDPRLTRYETEGTTGQGGNRIKYSREQ